MTHSYTHMGSTPIQQLPGTFYPFADPNDLTEMIHIRYKTPDGVIYRSVHEWLGMQSTQEALWRICDHSKSVEDILAEHFTRTTNHGVSVHATDPQNTDAVPTTATFYPWSDKSKPTTWWLRYRGEDNVLYQSTRTWQTDGTHWTGFAPRDVQAALWDIASSDQNIAYILGMQFTPVGED